LDAGGLIGYVHVADSNRLAPGWGHIPFDEIFASFQVIGYNGWLTVEILPKPEPEAAARQAIRFLRVRFADRAANRTGDCEQ
jgi:sugar phosphate isomerase/epimerase